MPFPIPIKSRVSMVSLWVCMCVYSVHTVRTCLDILNKLVSFICKTFHFILLYIFICVLTKKLIFLASQDVYAGNLMSLYAVVGYFPLDTLVEVTSLSSFT